MGNYDGLLVLDWNGTVLTQSDQYIYCVDVYEIRIYMRQKIDHLACADVQTLANAHEIRYAFDEESERSYERLGILFISRMVHCGATISVNRMQVII